MAIKPTCMSLRALGVMLAMRSTAFLQASCGCRPCRMNSTTKKLPQLRMTSSPCPVAVAAPMALSTYRPAPMMGESPTRPRSLKAMPLVVQAPLRLPCMSMAIMPMVSWLLGLLFSMLIFWSFCPSR